MSLGKQISEIGLKVKLDDFVAEGERFRAFDKNFLPIGLDHMKESYQYILEVFTRKCGDAVKYYHLSNKYADQINEEMSEINKLLTEAEEFDKVADREKMQAMKAAAEISNFSHSALDIIKSYHEAPKDIYLAFKAFLQLGPQGTQGGSDLSWDAIKALIKDKDRLAQLMRELFEDRIEDISRSEIEKAQENLKHLTSEYSIREGTHKCPPLPKIMGTYVMSCLAYWDMAQARQARHELVQLKKNRIDSIKTELATYRELVNIYEKDLDEIFEKYKMAKQEYETVKKDSTKADEALRRFEDHYHELEQESNKDNRDHSRINNLLSGLRDDCHNFGNIRAKLIYKLPADTLIG